MALPVKTCQDTNGGGVPSEVHRVCGFHGKTSGYISTLLFISTLSDPSKGLCPFPFRPGLPRTSLRSTGAPHFDPLVFSEGEGKDDRRPSREVETGVPSVSLVLGSDEVGPAESGRFGVS